MMLIDGLIKGKVCAFSRLCRSFHGATCPAERSAAVSGEAQRPSDGCSHKTQVRGDTWGKSDDLKVPITVIKRIVYLHAESISSLIYQLTEY